MRCREPVKRRGCRLWRLSCYGAGVQADEAGAEVEDVGAGGGAEGGGDGVEAAVAPGEGTVAAHEVDGFADGDGERAEQFGDGDGAQNRRIDTARDAATHSA
jgi:hypothetical protein